MSFPISTTVIPGTPSFMKPNVTIARVPGVPSSFQIGDLLVRVISLDPTPWVITEISPNTITVSSSGNIETIITSNFKLWKKIVVVP